MTVSSNDNVSNKTDAENSVEQINSVDEANTSEIISSENEIKRTETVNGTGFKRFQNAMEKQMKAEEI